MTADPRTTSWPFSIFGGCNGTARALNLTPSTVQYWVDQGRIPQDRWDAIIAAAAAVGATVSPTELYAMKPASPLAPEAETAA